MRAGTEEREGMTPTPPIPYVRLRVGSRLFAVVDADRVDELREGPAWSVWRRRGTRFVARWVRDDHGRRRFQGLLSVVARAQPGEKVVPRDGDWLNCTEANVRVLFGRISRHPNNARNPWELRVRCRGRVYWCGAWPTREYAVEILDALKPVVQQARTENWTARQIREAIDRATCRIRDRERGPNAKSTTEIIRGEEDAENTEG